MNNLVFMSASCVNTHSEYCRNPIATLIQRKNGVSFRQQCSQFARELQTTAEKITTG
ncbi:hypothetical protein [Polymorphobacter arshaanensis]|uniref:hypothetical protein n=1 Tax=Glacieibacterium arshaanense TaxID=2511025 RepID=UPI0014085D86|nr:hypothetical protein [Polymorphobacter arshaanensis]